MLERVIAARAIAAGVRVASWMIPEPSSILSVRAARYPSGEGASEPHASATQQMSIPSRSASVTKSTVSRQLPPEASIVVDVRITRPALPEPGRPRPGP